MAERSVSQTEDNKAPEDIVFCHRVFYLYVGEFKLPQKRTAFSGAAKDQILGWTSTGGRLSSILHQMKAKNLRIQKLCDAGTEKLYKQRYCTVSMATFLKQ